MNKSTAVRYLPPALLTSAWAAPGSTPLHSNKKRNPSAKRRSKRAMASASRRKNR